MPKNELVVKKILSLAENRIDSQVLFFHILTCFHTHDPIWFIRKGLFAPFYKFLHVIHQHMSYSL